jgi:NAD(P)-dependent dehydrogenase (short-subunit alcohol dehydrogenase family)
VTTGALATRSAVVTGGGRGIGAAVARALVGAGARVVVASRTREEIERVANELRAGGGQAFAHACDLTEEASVQALGAFANDTVGAVDILVNNAGGSSSGPLHRITLEEWNRMLAVNATSSFLCTREFAPAMVARGLGRIVNVASIAGLEGARYVAAYSAAKHAVVGFTRALAAELADTGVTANAVCPAYVDTPMMARSIENVRSRTGKSADEALSAVLATTGQDRLIAPEEVAAAVLELCMDGAATTTGEAIVMRPVGSPR